MPGPDTVRILTVGDRIDPVELEGAGFVVTSEPTLTAAANRLDAERSTFDCLVGGVTAPTGSRSGLKSLRREFPRLPFVLVDAGGGAGEKSLSDERTMVVSDTGSSEAIVEAVKALTDDAGASWFGDSPMDHIDVIADGFFVLDEEWRFTYINPEGERLIERDADELIGKIVWEEFEAAVDLAFYSETRRAMETQEPVTFEEYYPPLDTWFEVHAYPTPDRLAVYFIDISQRKSLERALLSGGSVELEFDIQRDSDVRVLEFARRIDGWFRLEGIVPHTGRSGIVYGTVGSADFETVEEAARCMETVADARLIESHESGLLVEFSLTDLDFARGLAKHSATLQDLKVTTEGGRMVVTLPQSSDVRDFVEMLEENRPGITLVAQRNDPETVGGRINRPLQERLTDRQVEVLEVAFASGYFEWPREITGEELADSLDIAPPTLHQHLRKGLSNVLDGVLMSTDASEQTD